MSTTSAVRDTICIAKVSICTGNREWNQYSEQKSGAIYLQAGQWYYIEALQKEEGSGDYVSVGWQSPGFSGPVVIESQYLRPIDCPVGSQ